MYASICLLLAFMLIPSWILIWLISPTIYCYFCSVIYLLRICKLLLKNVVITISGVDSFVWIQIFIQNHFPSGRRTSLTFLVVPMLVMNSFTFLCLKKTSFAFIFKKGILARYRILGWWIFFPLQYFKKAIPLPSYLYCFWWEICYKFHLCSSTCNVSSGCLKHFLSVAGFELFDYNLPWCSLCTLCLGFIELLGSLS